MTASTGSGPDTALRTGFWSKIRPDTVARILAALILVALGVIVLIPWITPAEAGAAFAFLVAAAVAVWMRPVHAVRLTRAINKFEAFGTSIEFRQIAADAERAAAQSVADDDPDQEAVSSDLIELRLSVERKLTYIAKEILATYNGDAKTPTYVTIGSLNYDGLLTDEQAQTLARLMAMSDEEHRLMNRKGGREFLENTGRVVANLRAIVFRRYVEQQLERHGWKTARGAAPTFASIWTRGAERILVRPILDTGGEKITARSAQQVVENWTGDVRRRIVVVPDQRMVPTANAGMETAVLALREFLEEISAPPTGDSNATEAVARGRVAAPGATGTG